MANPDGIRIDMCVVAAGCLAMLCGAGDVGHTPRARRRSRGWLRLAMLATLSLPMLGAAAEPATVIRSGSELAYPPFCLVDAQGRADGFAVELLREALLAMNRGVDFRVGEWNDVRRWPVPVVIDPSQVDQILMNLCVNACDAISGSGRLGIEIDVAAIDAAYCGQHADALPGDYAMLAVSDSGCGMTPEAMSHVFEPFFTTKAQGVGTGLGLATVYGIVRQNRGFVNVYSEAGRGATFKIYLPLTGTEAADAPRTEAADAPRTEAVAAPAQGGATETLLLVEDERPILKSTERYLASLGYTVLACATAEEALQQAAAHAGPIPLLVTDVMLPGMDGRALSNRLRASRPAIKTLFMSGYTADVIAHQGVLDPDANFLQKPASMASLAARIRSLINTEAHPVTPAITPKDNS